MEEKTETSYHHFAVSIEGLLRKKNLNDYFFVGGVGTSDRAARQYLKECQAKGWKVLPMAKCDRFNHQKGCPGHKEKN